MLLSKLFLTFYQKQVIVVMFKCTEWEGACRREIACETKLVPIKGKVQHSAYTKVRKNTSQKK